MYFWFTKHFYCHSQHETERWGLGGHLGSRPQATTVGSATLPGDITSLSLSFLICPVKSATPSLLFVARGSVSGQPVASPLLALLPPLQPPLPAPSRAPPLHCTRPWAFARQGVESDLSPPTCCWGGWARAAWDSCPNSPPGWGWVRKRGGKKEGRGAPKGRLQFCQRRLLCSEMPGQGSQLCQRGDWPPTIMFFPGFPEGISCFLIQTIRRRLTCAESQNA